MSIIKKIEAAQIEKLKTATNSVSRFSKVLLSHAMVAREIMHPLQYVVNHTVLVWNVNSHCTALQSKRLKRFVLVKYVVQSYSSCVGCRVKRRVLSKTWQQQVQKIAQNNKIPHLGDF